MTRKIGEIAAATLDWVASGNPHAPDALRKLPMADQVALYKGAHELRTAIEDKVAALQAEAETHE